MVGSLPGRQLRPLPAVIGRPRSAFEFGDQLADRAGPVGVRIEPGVIDLQEDPLRPLVVVDIGGGEASALVVSEAEPAQLPAEVDDIGLGAGAGMSAGLDGILLSGQSKGVKTQGMQHIAAGHPEVPRIDVGGDVAQRMADVQALTGRVGEHVLNEHLVLRHWFAVFWRQGTDRIINVEGSPALPAVLPLGLDPPGEFGRVAIRRNVGVGFPGVGGRGFGHADRVSVVVRLTTARYRLRCMQVRGWFQVDSGPVIDNPRCLQSTRTAGQFRAVGARAQPSGATIARRGCLQ